MEKWSQTEGILLSQLIQQLAPEFGAHFALTGGLLYKTGMRKDADFLFYRIRQINQIDREGLVAALEERLGLTRGAKHGWVQKMDYRSKSVDLFFPDYVDRPGDGSGEYP